MRTKAVVVVAASMLLFPALVFGQAAKRNPAEDFVMPGPIVPLPVAIGAAADAIREEKIAAHIEFLAAPSLEGRGLGRQGLEAAADYIATTLALAGIRPHATRPATRDGYFQPVPLRQVTNPRGQLTVESQAAFGARSQTFLSGIDCVFPDVEPQVLSGPVVFAGYGIREPSLARDDYRDLDVRGKIVAVLGGLPAGADWQKPDLVSRYGAARGPRRYAAKLEIAAVAGARAVLVLESPEFSAALASSAPAPAPYFLPSDGSVPGAPPLVAASAAVTGALLGADVQALEAARPRALPGITVTMPGRR